MNLASSFQISHRISGRRNLRKPVKAAGMPRDFTEVTELSIIWVGSEFQLLRRDGIAEGKILHKILQVEVHPLPSSQKIRGKALFQCQFQCKWCEGWYGMKILCSNALLPYIQLLGLPLEKINGCCKSNSSNVCQDFLVFLESEHFMYNL